MEIRRAFNSDVERILSTAGGGSAKPVRQSDSDTPKATAGPEIVSCQRAQDRERSNLLRRSARHVRSRGARFGHEKLARARIAAMVGSIDQRPKNPSRFRVRVRPAKEARTDAEQDSTAKSQSVSLGLAPWEGFEERKPRVLKPRQFEAGNPAAE